MIGKKVLLQEYYALCPGGVCQDFLTEQEKKEVSGGAMYLTGLMQKADEKNNNSRIYRYPILFREIEAYKKAINERRALGALDHLDDSVVTLRDACVLVTDIWWEGKDVYGKMKVLSNRHGQDLQCLIREDGVQVGISSRGLGSLSDDGSGNLLVEDDFQLICFDIVSDPSTRGAFMSPTALNESRINALRGTKADRINRAMQDILISNSLEA